MKRTFQTAITFTETGQELLEELGTFLGMCRGKDYKSLQQGMSRQARREFLYTFKLNKREADNIIRTNDDTLAFVTRTAEMNISNWETDLSRIDATLHKDDLPAFRRHSLTQKYEKLTRKIKERRLDPTRVVFGGRKAFSAWSKHPYDKDKYEDLVNKRLFLTFLGDKERKGGNTVISINPETWSVSLRVPQFLDEKHEYVEIGTINPKSGTQFLRHTLENNLAVTYEFMWHIKSRKWRLHFTVDLPDSEKGSRASHGFIPGRVLGIDTNAGHLDMSVIDSHSNVLYQETYHYTEKDVDETISHVVRLAHHHYVEIIAVENLSGLTRNRSSKTLSSKNMNKKLTSMLYGKLHTRLESAAYSYDMKVVKINPAYTSKNTSLWPEAYFAGSQSRHVKASFLIARRALGLKLTRRKKLSVCDDSRGLIRNTYNFAGEFQPKYVELFAKFARKDRTSSALVESLA